MLKDKLNILSRLAVVTPTGATTHQEADFGLLLEPKLRKVFYETYDEVPEQYSKVFNIDSSKKAQETDFHLGAMSEWEEFGQAIPGKTADVDNMPTVKYSKINPADTIVYTHKEFAKGFMVERKFMDDEKYKVIEKMTKDLARAGRYKVESDAAKVFDNAFTVNGYDGVPLISATHKLANSVNKCSNIVYGALSDTALKEALTLGRRQVDEAGKIIQMKFDTLVVSPKNEFLAHELIKSTNKTGGDLNDINVLKDRFKIVVMDFVTKDDAWFIMDSSRHQLQFFWRVKPEFGKEKDFDSYVTKYSGYMRYSYGYSDFRGIIGSDGVTAKPGV
mgnify:CR=1 FL=1